MLLVLKDIVSRINFKQNVSVFFARFDCKTGTFTYFPTGFIGEINGCCAIGWNGNGERRFTVFSFPM